MIFSLVYTAFVIAAAAILIKKIKNLPVETIEKPNGKIKKKYKPHHFAAALLSGTITALLCIMIPVVLLFDMMIEDYWLFFGKKRIAYIESRFGITVDDDIKLKRYQKIGGREGADSLLEFECKMNGREFFESKFNGTLYQYEEDGVLYTLDPDTGEYKNDGRSGSSRDRYRFRTSEGKLIDAAFIPKEDGSGYKVRLD